MAKTLAKGFIDKKEKGSGEYQDLYLEGIEFLQQLSGANWSDYNEHDPGVTIFENIAYTLTNLDYKTNLPIADILTESKSKIYEKEHGNYLLKTKNRSRRKPDPLKSGDNGFFIASDILSTNPIIKEDYRKMFVDGINNVKNVWIRTHNQDQPENSHLKQRNNLRGLYHVFVEMYDYHEDMSVRHAEENRIIDKIKELFHAHRNLCEDIYQVTILEPFLLDLKLELTLDMTVDGEDVFAEVYYKVNDYLTHEARFQSLYELREEDVDVNSIYEGPSLTNGFMKNEELKELKNQLFTSEITKIISKVNGVVSIDKFEIKEDYDNKPPFKYELVIPEGKSPRLNIPISNDKLAFKTADILLKPDVREIKKRYVSMEAEYYGSFKTASQSANMSEIPHGDSLGISSYYSIREQFPAIYGIGKFGLPKTVSKKRKAQAKQLKAYLLPFDQLMANFLGQLTNLFSLYNVHQDSIQTHFYQELEDMPELAELIKLDPKNKKEPLDQWEDTLKELNNQFDSKSIARLNQVADSLLARYAEQFPTYVLQKINTSCFGKHFTDEDFDKRLLAWKRKLVANYGRLSYNRAKSFNYTEKQDVSSAAIPHHIAATIVEKMSILLGIQHSETRNLSAHVDHVSMTPELILEEEVIVLKDDEVIIMEKLVEGVKNRIDLTGEDESRVNDILASGVVKSNYVVRPSPQNKKEFDVWLKIDSDAKNNIKLMSGLSKKAARIADAHSMKFLKKLNDKTEGIHLIEHLLLAPPIQGEHFGFEFSINLNYNELVKFRQPRLLSNHNRNRFVDSIIDKIENSEQIYFKRVGQLGSIRIEIFQDEDRSLAISESKFRSIEETDRHIASLRKLVSSKQGIQIKELKYFAYYGESEMVNEDFFSFRMTFVLPSWPVRFQQESFQRQFTNILYQHAPIHLQYQSHWLGLPRMRSFEAMYFAWLKLLSQEDKNEVTMPIAYELIQQIKQYQKEGEA